MDKYVIGLDFGTLSVRALLVNAKTGEECAVKVYEYPHGVMDDRIPTGEWLPMGWALQEPQDYLDGMKAVITGVLKKTRLMPEQVIGMGVAFTAATVIPVTEDGTPLCQLEEFRRNPHAYVKLWKHHGAEKEADDIERNIKERGEDWLSYYGGKVSSEWMLPKILETVRYAPEVYEKTAYFLEAGEWITWVLTGEKHRAASALGFKVFYRDGKGFPSNEFFKALDPRMDQFPEKKMMAPILPIGACAGHLKKSLAESYGLSVDTKVGVSITDSLSSVVGSGIVTSGEMMIVVGTSACHMLLSEKEEGVPGVCGIVKDGIVPGFYGYEAGQCCVGEHFSWVTEQCIPDSYHKEAKEKHIGIYQLLTEKLEGYCAGQSGLLALDWFNGVRSPLMDTDLSGLILGLNLHTKPEEIYMCLLEAVAYGTRLIIDQFEQEGIRVNSIVLGGGIPKKDPLLVQTYANVLNRPITLSGTAQASGRGAAILGLAAVEADADPSKTREIIKNFGKKGEQCYQPDPNQVPVYEQLYEEYKRLQEYFGLGGNDVMKRLNQLKRS